jgi:hypothetical protein
MMLAYPAGVPETWVTTSGDALFARCMIYNKSRTEPAGYNAFD